ncbi:hypothetical protein EV182_001495 [Spiromyces aspiralis]|uniref:Uncharacterized protein n=1 Tax=Spiromyces aspiralis TaxID=68401 RepID=A0ACC1HT25_9FUNG|nr:hypothetical protein EV182_001495 [Spiromyces aspiralis]
MAARLFGACLHVRRLAQPVSLLQMSRLPAGAARHRANLLPQRLTTLQQYSAARHYHNYPQYSAHHTLRRKAALQAKVLRRKVLFGRLTDRLARLFRTLIGGSSQIGPSRIIQRIAPQVRTARLRAQPHFLRLHGEFMRFSQRFVGNWATATYTRMAMGRALPHPAFGSGGRWQVFSKTFAAQFRTLHRPLGAKWASGIQQQQAMAHTLATYRMDRPKITVAAKFASTRRDQQYALKQRAAKRPRVDQSAGAEIPRNSERWPDVADLKALMNPHSSDANYRHAMQLVQDWAARGAEVPADQPVVIVPFSSVLDASVLQRHKLLVRRLIKKVDAAGIGARFMPVASPFRGICVVFPSDRFPTARAVEAFVGATLGFDLESVGAVVWDPLTAKGGQPALVASPPLLATISDIDDGSGSSSSSSIDCVSLDMLDDSLFSAILEESVVFEAPHDRELRLFMEELDQFMEQMPAFSNRTITSTSRRTRLMVDQRLDP